VITALSNKKDQFFKCNQNSYSQKPDFIIPSSIKPPTTKLKHPTFKKYFKASNRSDISLPHIDLVVKV